MVWGLRASPVNLEVVLGTQRYHGLMSWLGQLRFIGKNSQTLQLSQPVTPWLFLCFTYPFYLFPPTLQNRHKYSFHPPVFVYLDVNWFKGMLPKHRFERIGTFLLVKASRHYQNSGSKIAITLFFSFSCSCFTTSPWIPKQSLSSGFWTHTFRDYFLIVMVW